MNLHIAFLQPKNQWQLPDPKFFIPFVIAFLILIMLIVWARAEIDYLTFSNEQIANAIYLAEGGKKAKVPYGILSVKVKDEQEAKQICINTIRNNRVRFAKQNKYTDFIEFLGSRYAPIQSVANDPKGLNRFWIKNVKYFLIKQ